VNATAPAAEALRAALASLLQGLPQRQTARAVERLISHYRGEVPTDAPVLRDRADVAAYAAYRMPATFQAVRAALAGLRAAAPEWVPGTHADVGGGTGAASWAVADTWSEPLATTVLDWAEPALALGRELASAAPSQSLRSAQWRRLVIGADLQLPTTDLLTISYVLNELTPQARRSLITEAARSAQAVVLVEPGTPEGYLRVRAARDQLIDTGLHIAAPCPHRSGCPLEVGSDWCHFAARVSRSSLHRQIKGGSLPYEDEKFSYLIATRFPATPARSRVVRKPLIRKGQVLLDLCGAPPGLAREAVTKRHGSLYRTARDVAWGDEWPQPPTAG
jgi:ribosomal protein RSM22 (predicted rRNA methylase)